MQGTLHDITVHTLGRVLVNRPAALLSSQSMKLLIVLSAFCAIGMASPAYVSPVYPYVYRVGVPVGYDGTVLDTPEVAHAKAVHLATQAYEAVRNTLGYSYIPQVAHVYAPAISYGAPIGPDGRVVDTPEVAQAKAAHLAAHAQEIAKTIGRPYGALAYALSPYAYGVAYSAPFGEGRKAMDTPEVAEAKSTQSSVHAEEASKAASRR